MANTLPIQKLITVNVTITATAAQGPNLNSLMIVGDTEGVIDTTERLRQYPGLTAVAGDFGTLAPEYLAAQVFFAQQPTPSLLFVGRWAKTATHGRLRCAPLSPANSLIGAWSGIANAAFLVFVDGVPYNVTGVSFVGDANLPAVAAAIQTALQAEAGIVAGAAVVYNSNFNRFEFASGSTGVASSVSFLATSAATGSITFTGNPANNDTVTIKGTVVTFVAAGPVGNQVLIGASQAATEAAFIAFLNASNDVNLSAISYSLVGSVVYLVSKATGATGNAYTLAKTSAVITVSGADLSGGVVGTDISGQIGGTNLLNSGAYLSPGVAAEAALSGVLAIEAVQANWYGLNFAAGANNTDIADSDHLAIAAYIEGDSNRHLYGLTTAEGAALLNGDTTSIGALLKALGYNRTFYQWSSQNPYASCGLFGVGVTVNFAAQNSTLTFMWKAETGVVAESLNTTQAANLDANNYNYYANFNTGGSVVGVTVNGTVASGHFIDEIWNADWFGSSIQIAGFNLARSLPKIPQTDAGSHMLAAVFEGVCKQGVLNGFLAPGQWNSNGFGQISFGSFLSKGYYIYTPPTAAQAQTTRSARQSVAFQIAAKEAGAVHDIQVNVTVNQ
jgi:hypothetical protein